MSFKSNSSRRRGRGCSGVASLELALVLIPFLYLMLGVIDFSRYFFTTHSMMTLMDAAARYAFVYNGNVGQGGNAPMTCDGGTDPWPQTPAIAPLLDPTQASVCVTQLNQNGGVIQFQVTVQYPFVAITPWLSSLFNSPLQEQANYSE